MSKINEQIERLRELVRKCYGAVAGKKGTIPNVGERTMSNLAAAIESIPIGVDLSEFKYIDGESPSSAIDLLFNMRYVESVDTAATGISFHNKLGPSPGYTHFSVFGGGSNNAIAFMLLKSFKANNITSITGGTYSSLLNYCQSLEEVEMNNLEIFGMGGGGDGGSFLCFCNKIESITFPKLKKFNSNGYTTTVFGKSCAALKYVNLPALEQVDSAFQLFQSSPNVIDFRTGKITSVLRGTFSLSYWSPTNALLEDSQSLLTEEDVTSGFTSNRQKLLYNIREHIAANLPVASYTIKFSAEIKAAILADQETADAFTNRGWTIA